MYRKKDVRSRKTRKNKKKDQRYKGKLKQNLLEIYLKLLKFACKGIIG